MGFGLCIFFSFAFYYLFIYFVSVMSKSLLYCSASVTTVYGHPTLPMYLTRLCWPLCLSHFYCIKVLLIRSLIESLIMQQLVRRYLFSLMKFPSPWFFVGCLQIKLYVVISSLWRNKMGFHWFFSIFFICLISFFSHMEGSLSGHTYVFADTGKLRGKDLRGP